MGPKDNLNNYINPICQKYIKVHDVYATLAHFGSSNTKGILTFFFFSLVLNSFKNNVCFSNRFGIREYGSTL